VGRCPSACLRAVPVLCDDGRGGLGVGWVRGKALRAEARGRRHRPAALIFVRHMDQRDGRRENVFMPCSLAWRRAVRALAQRLGREWRMLPTALQATYANFSRQPSRRRRVRGASCSSGPAWWLGSPPRPTSRCWRVAYRRARSAALRRRQYRRAGSSRRPRASVRRRRVWSRYYRSESTGGSRTSSTSTNLSSVDGPVGQKE
jgi:hypothetical protein